MLLPNEDGLKLCKQLRQNSEVPIIISALNSISERVLGLEYGADDYLIKPFNHRELLARVHAILRRFSYNNSEFAVIEFSNFTLNTKLRKLSSETTGEIELSSGLYEFLLAFVKHPHNLLSRSELLKLTHTTETDGSFARSIDIQISRLRTLLKKNNQLVPSVYL